MTDKELGPDRARQFELIQKMEVDDLSPDETIEFLQLVTALIGSDDNLGHEVDRRLLAVKNKKSINGGGFSV